MVNGALSPLRGKIMRKFFGTLLILLATFFECGVCAQPQQALFSAPLDGMQETLPSVNPHVVLRQRLVTVQFAVLGGGYELVVYLNPFVDIQLKAKWERTDRSQNGFFCWYGHIEGDPSSEVALVWDGSRIAASITISDRKYSVRHLRDDLHLVRELDLTSLQVSSSAVRVEPFALQAVPSDYETDVLDLVNQERLAENLLSLTWNNQLHEAAREHSEDMATNDYFSHTSLDGRTAFDRIEDAGYQWGAAGENIAAGYSTPQAVVIGWMNSAGHRQNILSSKYCDLGVGYAYAPTSAYDHYWTQDFGRKIGVISCPGAVGQPPSASFTATPISGLAPLVVQFDASLSMDPEDGPLSFDWDFGDGQTGAGERPSHTYAKAGSYTVTLTVRDSAGSSDSLVRTNFITVSDSSTSKYVLVVHIEGQGTVMMSPAGGSYAPGTVVTVTAIPSNGWGFSEWSGDLSSPDNLVSITMDSPISLRATFTQAGNSDPVVSGSSGGGGSGGGCFIATISSWF